MCICVHTVHRYLLACYKSRSNTWPKIFITCLFIDKVNITALDYAPKLMYPSAVSPWSLSSYDYLLPQQLPVCQHLASLICYKDTKGPSYVNLGILKHHRSFSGLFSVWKYILDLYIEFTKKWNIVAPSTKVSFILHKYLNVYQLLLTRTVKIQEVNKSIQRNILKLEGNK